MGVMDFWGCICGWCGGWGSIVVCGLKVCVGIVVVTVLCAYIVYCGMGVGFIICGVMV